MAAKGLAATDFTPSGYLDTLGQSFMGFLFRHCFLRFLNSGFLLGIKHNILSYWIIPVNDKYAGFLRLCGPYLPE